MSTAGSGRADISLEERLRATEDQLEIMGLEAEYAVSWDTCAAERWADVFTEDGVFEMLPTGGRAGLRVEGRDALRTFCAETTARWTGLHFMHNPKITIDGDSARGVVFFEFKHVMRATNDHTLQGTVGGYYNVTYTRTEKGWRMKSRIEKAALASSTSFFEAMR